MKKSVLFAITIGLGAATIGILVLSLTADQRGTAHAPPSAAAAGPETGHPTELEALKREVASLKRMAVAQAVQTSALAASGTPATPARKARPPLAERKKALSEALEGQLHREAADPAWSAGRVATIQTAVARALPDVTLVAASCATTLCKVVVQHADPDSQGSFMERASGVEGLDSEGFFFFDRDATPPRTTAYLARPGQKLPRPAL